MDRLSLIKNHLSSTITPEDTKHLLKKYRSKSTINPSILKEWVYGDLTNLHDQVYEILSSDPIFKQAEINELDRTEHRITTLRQFHTLIKAFGLPSYDDLKNNPLKMLELAVPITRFDANLTIKLMVQFILYAQTLMVLGTSKHRKFIDDALALKDYGCFGLTELGHGSNVNGILTRADYDPATKEFVLNTPEKIGMKFWIAGVGQISNIGVVFAQLYVKGVHQGVHAFIVPFRNRETQRVLPGIVAGDCGAKVGWNGVDNGFLMFENVRVPYDNLLDKFCSIDGEGNYNSPIKNSGKRFALTISALSGGRVFVISSAVSNLVNSLTIAIRYAAVRRQFGPPQQLEVSILEYPLMQYRLMPYLAEVFGMAAAGHTIRRGWKNIQEKLFEENNPELVELHAIVSVIKAVSSWTTQKGAQECREVCGGLGYSTYNRLGTIVKDNDVALSGEGDNNVLLQQTIKFLLDSLRKLKEQKKLPFTTMYFLTENVPSYPDTKPGDVTEFEKDQFNIKRAFEVRTSKLVHDCAASLQRTLEAGVNPADAWNELQIYYGREASKAYCELFILNEYSASIEKCTDPATKAVLQKLYDLYGYHKIETGAAVLFETGYMTRQDLITVKEKIVVLCRELKDEAVGIIDAVATPDEILNSPIGASDGDVYNRFIGAFWTAPRSLEKAPYWREIVDRRRK